MNFIRLGVIMLVWFPLTLPQEIRAMITSYCIYINTCIWKYGGQAVWACRVVIATEALEMHLIKPYTCGVEFSSPCF